MGRSPLLMYSRTPKWGFFVVFGVTSMSCFDCRYFTGLEILPCGVDPIAAANSPELGCRDWQEGERVYQEEFSYFEEELTNILQYSYIYCYLYDEDFKDVDFEDVDFKV